MMVENFQTHQVLLPAIKQRVLALTSAAVQLCNALPSRAASPHQGLFSAVRQPGQALLSVATHPGPVQLMEALLASTAVLPSQAHLVAVVYPGRALLLGVMETPAIIAQEARLLGHSSRHSIPGAPINPSSGPFWSRKFYQGESEFLETVKDGSPWCGSKWPWMGPDGVHSVVRAQQWAAAWVCVRGSLIHRMAETHILSSPPGQWGVILPAYPESEDSLNQET